MLRALRRRLTATYLVLLALLLVAYALGSYSLASRALVENLDDTNKHLLAPIANGHAARSGERTQLLHELGELVLEPDEHVALLDAQGRRVFYRGAPSLAEPGLAFGARTSSPPERLRYLTLPVAGGGALRIARSLEPTDRALAALGFSLVGLIPFGVAFAGLAGSWLSRRAVAPVEAALERERQFTRDASHELRTPLAVIQLQAQLGAAGARPEEAERFGTIVATTRKLTELVADLLTLSRADAGMADSPLRFSLVEVVDEEWEALAPLAEARGVRLAPLEAPEEAWVSGEPNRLAQAVRNLLDNAIRYADAGGKVTVRVRAEGAHWWSVSVANSGGAIAEADRGRVFERFSRLSTGEARNPEGSGLGLAISQAIAQAHGGRVELAESDAEWTIFRLILPIAA